MKQRVGVVIPAYNASRFLDDALSSVFSQSISPTAIVVADDCSTDDTCEIARRRGVGVVLMPGNSGPASSRNAGVAALPDVDVVAFLDADDLWTSDHLERLLGGFGSVEVGVVHSRTGPLGQKVHEADRDAVAALPKDVLLEMLAHNLVSQSAVGVRRSAFEAVGGYTAGMRFSEDFDLWLRLACITKFVHVPVVTSLRRSHEGQASRKTARLVRGAFEARARGVEFARVHGRHISDTDVLKTENQLVQEILDSARHLGDRAMITELLSLFPSTTSSGQLVRSWWRARQWVWPLMKTKAMFRKAISG